MRNLLRPFNRNWFRVAKFFRDLKIFNKNARTFLSQCNARAFFLVLIKYSLRSILLFVNTDISRCILVVDSWMLMSCYRIENYSNICKIYFLYKLYKHNQQLHLVTILLYASELSKVWPLMKLKLCCDGIFFSCPPQDMMTDTKRYSAYIYFNFFLYVENAFFTTNL
jgi:hypothetical protein